MVMTVTLARGALRMADRKVIVKRLSAIHDLGAMDTLCVDKTGTLTEARITLEAHVDPRGGASDRTLGLAGLNSRFQAGVRSPLDDAILSTAGAGATDWSRLSEVPFDFARRCLSVLVARNGEHMLIAKGAPEAVLARSVAVETMAWLIRSTPSGNERWQTSKIDMPGTDSGFSPSPCGPFRPDSTPLISATRRI
jgi:Mg2+-importing ATPase